MGSLPSRINDHLAGRDHLILGVKLFVGLSLRHPPLIVVVVRPHGLVRRGLTPHRADQRNRAREPTKCMSPCSSHISMSFPYFDLRPSTYPRRWTIFVCWFTTDQTLAAGIETVMVAVPLPNVGSLYTAPDKIASTCVRISSCWVTKSRTNVPELISSP